MVVGKGKDNKNAMNKTTKIARTIKVSLQPFRPLRPLLLRPLRHPLLLRKKLRAQTRPKIST